MKLLFKAALACAVSGLVLAGCDQASTPGPKSVPVTTGITFSKASGTYELGSTGPTKTDGTVVTPAATVAPYANEAFPTSLSVSLTATGDWAGATIRYTQDGNDPSASSPAYTGPISVTTSQTLKARAFIGGTAQTVQSREYEVYQVLYMVDCGWTDKNSNGLKDDPGYILGLYQGEVDRAPGNGWDAVTGNWWGLATNCGTNLDSEADGDSFQRGWWDDDKTSAGAQGAHLLYRFSVADAVKTGGAASKLLVTVGIRSPWDDTTSAGKTVRPLDFYTSTDDGNWSTATNLIAHIDADNTYQVKSAVIDGTQIANTHDLLVFAKCTRMNGAKWDNALLGTVRVSQKR